MVYVQKHHLEAKVQQTIVLLESGKLSSKSTAAIRILWILGGANRISAAALWLVPRPLRDWVYTRIANNRHRLNSGCKS